MEIFSQENDALSSQVTQLREEIVNLKTLLLAHKDCPVSQAQGIGGMAMNGMNNDFNHHTNPYGMAMPNGQMPGQAMGQRLDTRQFSTPFDARYGHIAHNPSVHPFTASYSRPSGVCNPFATAFP